MKTVLILSINDQIVKHVIICGNYWRNKTLENWKKQYGKGFLKATITEEPVIVIKERSSYKKSKPKGYINTLHVPRKNLKSNIKRDW